MPIMGVNKWIEDVEQGITKLNDKVRVADHSSIELEKWQKRSIYKVPHHVVETNEKLYVPQLVSIGPYHHDVVKLQEMEEHKTRALYHFLKRSKIEIRSLYQAFEVELEYLQEAYDLQDHDNWKNDKEEFLMLMIQDGCFILEVLNVYSKNVVYSPHDPIFGIHGITDVLPLIKRDMLLLQNQVPFRVIRILLAAAEGQVGGYGGPIPDQLLYLLLRFFSTSTSSLYLVWSKISERPCLHLLDVYREVLLYENFRILYKRRTRHEYTSTNADGAHFPSASKLYEAGIRFKKSSSTHLKDISFHGSKLKFPPIVITDETISTLANLMAFERAHSSIGNDVMTYVFFMTCLIQNAEDVSLLKASGIIQNTIYSDDHVVVSLSELSKVVLLGPNNTLDEVYEMVSRKLRSRVKKTLNEWWVDLFRTYFKTPWGVLSVVAAAILLTLTTLQTVYTILSYNKQG